MAEAGSDGTEEVSNQPEVQDDSSALMRFNSLTALLHQYINDWDVTIKVFDTNLRNTGFYSPSRGVFDKIEVTVHKSEDLFRGAIKIPYNSIICPRGSLKEKKRIMVATAACNLQYMVTETSTDMVKIERIKEMESEPTDKVPMETPYLAQQVSLQRELEITKEALDQANSTIKDNEEKLFDLFKSEDELTDSESEDADLEENGNTTLVQNFRAKLTQQLGSLHKTVEASFLQQKKMQSFVLKLQGMISAGVASTSDILPNKLLDNISKLGEMLAACAEKQREGSSRTKHMIQSLFTITEKLFETLDELASKILETVEEAETANDQKLLEFEKKYEECAENEEKRLLSEVAELIESSSVIKKNLVQKEIDDLGRAFTSKLRELQEEIASITNKQMET